MRQLMFIFTAVAIIIILPWAGGIALSSLEAEGPVRLTVVQKNLTSPTLEELGQKAGDPSPVEAPVDPVVFEERKAQWI